MYLIGRSFPFVLFYRELLLFFMQNSFARFLIEPWLVAYIFFPSNYEIVVSFSKKKKNPQPFRLISRKD